VVIAAYDGDQLVALGDNDDGEPNVYLYGDPEVRELVAAHGPTARAVTFHEFRKLAGEEMLSVFRSSAVTGERPTTSRCCT
jgi:hypothetical protein